MTTRLKTKMGFRRAVSGLILLCFLSGQVFCPSASYAQSVLALPMPGAMVAVSSGYVPIAIKGLKVYPDNPFRFDFILDTGNSKLQGQELKDETSLLIKYFLTALTVPDDDQWVNLSPYEKDRIIPKEFGITEMGRDLLAQDYLLKQLTASLIYPEQELGKKFWERVHKKAYEKYGNVDIPVDTFNKVWIMPEHAKVYESGSVAFITESHLKVMLESDYLALEKSTVIASVSESRGTSAAKQSRFEIAASPSAPRNDTNAIGSSVVREIVLPEIEKEVNEGKNFTKLRQIYHSMIMAAWFKRKLKNGMLGKIYVGANKVAGVEYTNSVIASEVSPGGTNPEAKAIKAERSAENRSFSAEVKQSLSDKELIYQQYLVAFKQGVYNYIKEEVDEATQETIPRKYFSGGFTGGQAVSSSTLFQIASSPAQLSQEISSSTVGNLLTAQAGLESVPGLGVGDTIFIEKPQFLKKIRKQEIKQELIEIKENPISVESFEFKTIVNLLTLAVVEWGKDSSKVPQSLKKYYKDSSAYVLNSTALIRRDGYLINPDGTYKLVVVQIGRLSYFLQETYDSLAQELKSVLTKNVVILPNFDSFMMFDLFSTPMIFDLQTHNVNDYIWIDSGSGSGILALSILKLDGSFVYLVDYDEESLEQAREFLAKNGFIEGQHFKINQGDLLNKDFIIRKSGEIDVFAHNVNKAVAIISNIGYWPKDYLVTNKHSMQFFEYITQATLFIAGGYDPISPAVSQEEVQRDIDALKMVGFHPDPNLITSSDDLDVSLKSHSILSLSASKVLNDLQEIERITATLATSDNSKQSDKGTESKTLKAAESQGLGGIDMNQKALDLQIEGEGIKFSAKGGSASGTDMPFDPTQLQNIQIDGFSPVILQIVPTNLPVLIGVKQTEKELQLSQLNGAQYE